MQKLMRPADDIGLTIKPRDVYRSQARLSPHRSPREAKQRPFKKGDRQAYDLWQHQKRYCEKSLPSRATSLDDNQKLTNVAKLQMVALETRNGGSSLN